MKHLRFCLALVSLAACGEPAQEPTPSKTATPKSQSGYSPPANDVRTETSEALEVAIASPTKAIAAESAVALTATVTKAGATYFWTQVSPKTPAGTFASPDAAETEWMAPAVVRKTIFVLSVSVELEDERSEETIKISVSPNNEPLLEIVAVSAMPAHVLSGSPIALSAKNTVGAKAFAWTQKAPSAPLGTFVDKTKASTTFTAPVVSAGASFILSLAYEDASGAAQSVDLVVEIAVPEYAADIKPIFQQRCAGCHSGASPSAGFDITKVASLTANAVLSSCGSGPRVKGGAPEGSVLYRRITGICVGGGARMPMGNPIYFDDHPDELAKIAAWLSAGAAF